tara:strand:+ start:443 stop:607 length:165 start_codon:yes stop_codon:yes gene_type:complete
MTSLNREDIKDLRERLDDLERKVEEMHQIIGQILGKQMLGDAKTKFFKIFFEKE